MMRIWTFICVGILAMNASCPRTSHRPSHSVGIEEFSSAQDLFQFAEGYRKKHGLPALGVGVVRDGEIIAIGMAGERKSESGDWATLNDRFDVASCSKSVTATVAALLVEKGLVRWDMTLQEVLPKMSESVLPVYKDVTLDMLLRHRSGLDQWMRTNELWMAWHRDHGNRSATEKRRLFTEKVLKDQPRYVPGTGSYYCNDGYVVAGHMIESVTGNAWEDSVREMLFEPLDLRTMRFGVPPSNATMAVAWGHDSSSFGRTRSIKPDPNEYGDPPFGTPGGFLYCTVADLLRFVDFHIQGANGNSKLLSRDSFAKLHTPLANERFGLGWEVEIKRDDQGRIVERSIYQGGFSGRFRANMWFCPETRTGTVIVYNHGGNDKADAYIDIFYALLRELNLGASN